MQADVPRPRLRRHGPSWAAVIGWVSVIVFAASLWSGADSGPIFWLGAASLDVVLVVWVCLLVRWITRRVDTSVR
ncbi:MAG: hypothetical protein ACRDY1_09690 [Acidimicrobiales bacterium]